MKTVVRFIAVFLLIPVSFMGCSGFTTFGLPHGVLMNTEQSPMERAIPLDKIDKGIVQPCESVNYYRYQSIFETEPSWTPGSGRWKWEDPPVNYHGSIVEMDYLLSFGIGFLVALAILRLHE